MKLFSICLILITTFTDQLLSSSPSNINKDIALSPLLMGLMSDNKSNEDFFVITSTDIENPDGFCDIITFYIQIVNDGPSSTFTGKISLFESQFENHSLKLWT